MILTAPDARQVALAYAAAGALVLPLHTPTAAGCSCLNRACDKPGKHPRTRHGKDDATNNPGTVERWWGMWPDANIGVRPAAGELVLDIDPRNGGHTQYEAMLAHYGPLPATRTAATGSGGLHLWFHWAGAPRKQLAPGIDIKTDSGYLVAPPSLHSSGQRYRWTNPGAITAAPAWLGLLVARPPVKPRRGGPGAGGPQTLDSLIKLVADAPDGELNNRLYWACCRAHEGGADTAPLVAAAIAKGHPERGAAATANSAANAPARTGSGLDALL